jgi:tetratricopeptide (TPR) repeat protein
MKNNIIILTATLLILGIKGASAQELDEAKDLIDSERFGSAEQLLEKDVLNNQGNAEANYLLVKVYLEQDKEKEAEAFLKSHLNEQAIQSDPLNRAAYAHYLFSTGDLPAAFQIINELLGEKKNQKNPVLMQALAQIMVDEKQGNAKDALTWLDLAQKKDRDNANIDILKGLAYRKLGDASNAYLSYQEAIKKDPANVRAHYLLGKIFRAQKNEDIYMQHFMKAYQLDSTYAPVLEELYNYYYYKDIPRAKKFLEKYIANTDYSLQNDYYMADILYLNGEYAKAINAANTIIAKEKINSQPRLYKLKAYSYAKSGDTLNAITSMNEYFAKETPAKFIAADYELMANLSKNTPGMEKSAVDYFTRAIDLDSLNSSKIKYATEVIELNKKIGDFGQQAYWLGKIYGWKEKTNNLDLFNWGLAYYKANDFVHTDSIFMLYTNRYPEDIYGYYWRAQANAAIDTSMQEGLAIPFYNKVVEIGEKDMTKNKNMLQKAYGYLGGYEANIRKDYAASLSWFEKYQQIDPENKEVAGYIETIKKWMDKK